MLRPWYKDRNKGAKGPLWVPRWGHCSSRDGGDSTKSPSLGPSIAELGLGLEQRILGWPHDLKPTNIHLTHSLECMNTQLSLQTPEN